jgi:maltose O-acetyltransferase
MNRFEKLKKRTVASLIRRWNDAQHATRLSAMKMTLGPGAVIHAEGSIDNQTGLNQAVMIGENTHIRGRLVVFPTGGSIKMGCWCYVGPRTEIWSMASVVIGDRVLISHGVNILDSSGHSKDAAERHTHFRQIVTTGYPNSWSELPGIKAAPIVIEDDAWISCGATILAGVRIGARSVIAANSIVTKDVPPDTLYRNEVRPVRYPLNQSTKSVR